MNAIKTHPLYREHHGEMKDEQGEWRYLENEITKPGDEGILNDEEDDRWGANILYGIMSNLHSNMAYRRRVTPAEAKPSDQKPVEQERFITVVYKVQNKFWDVVPQSEHFKTVSYREGNYLDKFDNSKERVLKALEGENEN